MRLILSLGLVVRTAKSRNSLFTNILHKLCWLSIYFHVSSFKFSCQNTTNKPHIMSKRIKFIFHEKVPHAHLEEYLLHQKFNLREEKKKRKMDCRRNLVPRIYPFVTDLQSPA